MLMEKSQSLNLDNNTKLQENFRTLTDNMLPLKRE